MTFATVADLQTRYGLQDLLLLADRDNSGAIDAGVVESHLQDADAEIVSLIGQAVTIDPENVPLNLRRVAAEIARYRLFGAAATDDVRARYKDAIAYLRLVATGQATLDGGSAAPAVAAPAAKAAATEPGTRIFRRGL